MITVWQLLSLSFSIYLSRVISLHLKAGFSSFLSSFLSGIFHKTSLDWHVWAWLFQVVNGINLTLHWCFWISSEAGECYSEFSPSLIIFDRVREAAMTGLMELTILLVQTHHQLITPEKWVQNCLQHLVNIQFIIYYQALGINLTNTVTENTLRKCCWK